MIYRFDPIVKQFVWGTESWIVSGIPGSESVVSGGPDDGKPISALFPGEFPLLIKLIDARRDLSIQVHPDDALAAQRHGTRGKTEMWYVTGADEGAKLLSGLKCSITPDEYRRRVADSSIADVLAEYSVSEGDVFFLPAGRIHAIGAGCRIAEIQTPSTITYRIFDYNRPGLDGKPRQLHVEEACDAIDYSVTDDYRTHYEACPDGEVTVVDCDFFKTALLDLGTEYTRSLADCRDFLIAICTEGSGLVGGTPLKAGEACLITADEVSVTFSPANGHFKIITTKTK